MPGESWSRRRKCNGHTERRARNTGARYIASKGGRKEGGAARAGQAACALSGEKDAETTRWWVECLKKASQRGLLLYARWEGVGRSRGGKEERAYG